MSAPRERRTTRRARTRLTPQLIVEAALEIIDGDGAEALTMRRLGSALGVEAMAIYHHYASKEAVLDAVAARLSQALHPAEFPADAPWEDRLRLIWTWFRDRLKEHPNALPLLFTRPVLSRGDLTGTEALLQALLDAGLSPREAVDAWRALGSYAIGYLTVERIFGGVRDQGWAPPRVDATRYPAWSAVLPHLGRDWDEQFQAALEVVLSGVRAAAAPPT